MGCARGGEWVLGMCIGCCLPIMTPNISLSVPSLLGFRGSAVSCGEHSRLMQTE